MNEITRGRRRWCRVRPRRAGVLAATAGLALLAACSSGSGSSADSGGSPSAGGSAHLKIVAFSHCMRSNGVPRYPDPFSGQVGVKIGLDMGQFYGVSNSQFTAAFRACRHVLPAGADGQFPAAMLPQILTGMRSFSRCMRSHGAPNWPDPSVNSQGEPVFRLPAGLNPSSPQVFNAADHTCLHLEPSQLHGGIPLG